MNELIEHNESLDQSLYIPSHLESLKRKHDYFEVPDHQQQNTTTLLNLPDLSDTASIQNVSELSAVTINNSQSFKTTSDSNILQFPIHNISQKTNNDPNQNDTKNNSNQDNTSTLSTTNTNKNQRSQMQEPSPRICDPSPVPSQYSTQTTPHNSPQLGYSNTMAQIPCSTCDTISNNHSNKTTKYTNSSVHSSSKYTNTKYTTLYTRLPINFFHSNTLPSHTASRNLSRPPLQTVPTNPLSYSLASTILNSTQHSTTSNDQLNTIIPFSTSQSSNMSRNILQNTNFQTSNLPYIYQNKPSY